MTVTTEALRALIRDVPDFPKPGIMFKDITPLLKDPAGFSEVISRLAERFAAQKLTHIVGIESRGFIFGAPLALKLGVGFVPARKPGKLPAAIDRAIYALEYGTDTLEMHKGSVAPGDRVLIVDDVIATGGTASAAADLVKIQGATVAAIAFVIELSFLNGRQRLPDGVEVFSVLSW